MDEKRGGKFSERHQFYSLSRKLVHFLDLRDLLRSPCIVLEHHDIVFYFISPQLGHFGHVSAVDHHSCTWLFALCSETERSPLKNLNSIKLDDKAKR